MTKPITIVDAYRDMKILKESKSDHYDQVASAISDLRNAYDELNTLYSAAQHYPDEVAKDIKVIREKLNELRDHIGMIKDAHNFCVDLIDEKRDIHNYIGEDKKNNKKILEDYVDGYLDGAPRKETIKNKFNGILKPGMKVAYSELLNVRGIPRPYYMTAIIYDFQTDRSLSFRFLNKKDNRLLTSIGETYAVFIDNKWLSVSKENFPLENRVSKQPK